MQHHPVALAEHVHRAAEGHDDVLEPFAAAPAEGGGGAGELHERGDVVAVGESDLDQHVTVLDVDGVDGLRSRGPQEPGQLRLERRPGPWLLGRWGRRRIGRHRLGCARVTGSGEHPGSIPRRGGATDVHPLGGAPTAPTGYLPAVRGTAPAACGKRHRRPASRCRRALGPGRAGLRRGVGTRPSDGRPLTQRARIGPSDPVVITLRTPIG